MLQMRAFAPDDAEFCFKVRTKACIMAFYDELGPQAVAAAVNAYMPSDYIRMADNHPFFVLEDAGTRVGFYTLRRLDQGTAEIPLIYLELDQIGRGSGSWCMQSIEAWLASHWPDVSTLVVETVIPHYNSGFYRKMGFTPVAETKCHFPDGDVKATRFEKSLPPAKSTP
jgi:GNAT superfamily N-acetyltransferase